MRNLSFYETKTEGARNQVQNLISLRKMKNLIELAANGNEIEKVDPLSDLKNLRTVQLNNNFIDLNDDETMKILSNIFKSGASVYHNKQRTNQ